MPTGKLIVFVSYAHRDEPEKPGPEGFAWLSFVLEYLSVGKRAGAFDLWVDTQMMGSANWREDIRAKLGVCDIFILLVSDRSMASDFILDEELPVIRERDAKGEAVHIYPVLLTPTPIVGLDHVRDKNIRPRDAQPLSKFSIEHDRREKMSEIADEIAKLAGQISGSAGSGGRASSTAARLTKIDIGHLPETSYKTLVGRDAELARLDAAWTNPEVNILSLVAEGGAGKSALLNEWLTLLRRENYRGAEVVLGWSFYSQGTHERATSSEQFLDWALQQFGARAKANNAGAKGEAIVDALTKRRVLLALDGVEPLQHGPASSEPGKLKDNGLRALLRHFAQQPPAGSPGLIVLTSRIEVADIAKWRQGAAPVERLEKLSDAAGAQILADGGVNGSPREREAASRDFGGHPLALQLLASYLKETQGGDVRRRDHIRGLLAEAENPGQDHARRVMESYEKEWLADKPVLLAILSIVGLFDRPADAGCIAALRAEPAIPGLTDELVRLREDDWSRAAHRLRDARCSRRSTPSTPGRSTPIRSCANGSAIGCGGRTRRHGRRRMAGSTSICAMPRKRATSRASLLSDRLSRHCPRLPRRTASRGVERSLQEPHFPKGI
jgi:hypothetical protein